VDEDEEEDDDDDVGAGAGGGDDGGGDDDDDGGGANLLMMRCLKPNVQSEEDPNLSLLSFSFQGVDVVLVRNVFMERWEWANDGMDMMMFSMLRGEASLKIWTMLRLVFLNGVNYELYPMHIFIYIYIIYIYTYIHALIDLCISIRRPTTTQDCEAVSRRGCILENSGAVTSCERLSVFNVIPSGNLKVCYRKWPIYNDL